MTKKFVPTEEQRRYVRSMTAMGITQEGIARILEINKNTVSRAFYREIAIAKDEANAKVANVLFKMATEDKNVSAAIFWLKTQARWKEPKAELELSGNPDAPLQIISEDPLTPEEWAARYAATKD